MEWDPRHRMGHAGYEKSVLQALSLMNQEAKRVATRVSSHCQYRIQRFVRDVGASRHSVPLRLSYPPSIPRSSHHVIVCASLY